MFFKFVSSLGLGINLWDNLSRFVKYYGIYLTN